MTDEYNIPTEPRMAVELTDTYNAVWIRTETGTWFNDKLKVDYTWPVLLQRRGPVRVTKEQSAFVPLTVAELNKLINNFRSRDPFCSDYDKVSTDPLSLKLTEYLDNLRGRNA